MDEEFDQQLPSEFADFFGLMVSATSEGLWAWDIKGNRLFWSDRLLTLLGFERGAYERKLSDFFEMVHPEDAEAVQAALDAHFKDRVPYEIEFRMLHRDGHAVPILSNGQAGWDSKGEPVRMVGSIRNLSDQESLLSTLARVERLAHIGHWHVNLDPPKLYWSPETYRIHGFEPGEFEPDVETAINFYHPDDRALIQRGVEGASIDGKPYDMKARIIHTSGEIRHVRAYAEVEKDVSGKPVAFFGTFQDITKEVLQEERLRKSSELEAIGRLVGGVAHDFNNLLSVIYGNLELLEDTEIGAEQRLYLSETLKAAERGAALTRQLLSFGRKAVLQPKPLEVVEALREAERMIRRVLPENIDVSVDAGDVELVLVIDPDQLQSSLLNLAINARDAMPNGGRLVIESTMQEIGPDDVQLDGEALTPGRYCAITMTDTGFGMAESTRQEAIVPFFTTKPVGEGSGLGLSMVHGFARQSGGALRISSAPGTGSSVSMLFPVLLEPKIPEEEVSTPNQPRPIGRILVVEDDPAVLQVVRTQLEAGGHKVETAFNGEEALTRLERGAEYDLILTDVVMPGSLQGPDLAQAVRRMKPGAKVIFMSGYPKEAAVGGNGLPSDILLLQKPLRRDLLLDAVQTAIGG